MVLLNVNICNVLASILQQSFLSFFRVHFRNNYDPGLRGRRHVRGDEDKVHVPGHDCVVVDNVCDV